MTSKSAFGILFFLFTNLPTYCQEYIVPDNTDFTGIQLVLSPDIKQEIASHVNAIYTNRKFFEEIIEKTDLFFPVIDKIFQQSAIHKDLHYIAILESGLTNELPEPSGDEAGIWKIKSNLAKETSLIINDQMDERMHFAQSTKAVSGILLKSNAIFNNWIYSMLAYHVGQETALTLADYKFYSARKMSLDAKTHWYIIKAVSYKLAFENYIGKNPNPKLLFFEYEGVPDQTLTEIAEANQIENADVKDFNTWFFGIKLPPDNKKYTVYIPLHAEAGVKQGLPRELYSNMPPPIFLMKNGLRAVQAKFGDTYQRLAEASGISETQLKEFNEIGPFNKLVHGQICYVEKKNKKPSKDIPPFHIVKYGETVWSISQHYGMITTLIRDFNWLYTGDELKPPEEPKIGQKLWLHQKRPKEAGVEIVLEIQEPEFSETALANSEKTDDEDSWSAFEEDTKPEKNEEKPVSNNLNTAPTEVLLSNKNPSEQKPDSGNSQASDKTSMPGMKETIPVSKPSPAESKTVTLTPEPEKETVSKPAALEPPVIAYHTEPAPETASAIKKTESKNEEPALPVIISENKNKPVLPEEIKPTGEKQNNSITSTRGETGIIYHTVEPNQNLFRISLQYNVPIQKIKEWNNLGSNSVSVGQVLKIVKDEKVLALVKEKQDKTNTRLQPSPKPSPAKEVQTEKPLLASTKKEPEQKVVNNSRKEEENKNPATTAVTTPVTLTSKETKPIREGNKSFHTVGEKETLFGIANKYKMSVNDLMQLNNFNSYNIKQGQRIEISDNASGLENFMIHTVATGETVVAIAIKYGYKVSEILAWNGKSTLDVNAGEKLKIRK